MNDGAGYIIRYVPSGQTLVFGPDGFETDAVHTDELSVGPNSERTIMYDSELGSLVVTE